MMSSSFGELRPPDLGHTSSSLTLHVVGGHIKCLRLHVVTLDSALNGNQTAVL